MRYSDFLTLSNFYSVYDLKAESEGYWKSFVSNNQFNDLLQTTIESFRNENPNRHRSLWILGTYGTGKSHASSVIKHLFCDGYENVREFIENSFKNDHAQLYSLLTDTVKRKKYFPIVLKSIEGVKDLMTFSLAIERAIKRDLNKAGITIRTKSEFENYAEYLAKNPHLNWDLIISNSPHLKDYVNNKTALIKKLNDFDEKIYSYLEEALIKAGIPLINKKSSIEDWIIEVQNELRLQNIADGLLIVWDEFTSVMGLNISGLLESVQDIAEVTMNPQNDSYLMLISHPDSFDNVNNQAYNKTEARFHIMRYKMESISAYHIMAMKLKVINDEGLNKLRSSSFSSMDQLISRFAETSNDTQQTRDDINKLFPIHPYTAFLCTYCAQEVGSSSRSVFNFMMDNDDFKAFFDDNEVFSNKELITADYLWDYFYETFRDDVKRYAVVTERFITNKASIESVGEDHFKVFKGILLMNALNNIAQNENVVPSEENIKNLFVGTPLFQRIENILQYINDYRIVQRNPNGIYSVQFSALPPQELEKAINEQKAAFNTVAKILKYGNFGEMEIAKIFHGLIREKNIAIFSSEVLEPSFKINRLNSEFKDKKSYSLHIAAIFAKNESELALIKEVVFDLSKEESFANKIFVVFNRPLGEPNYKRFIEYIASFQVATRHNNADQASIHKGFANETVTEWTNGIRQFPFSLYLRGEVATDSTQNLAKYINLSVTTRIFQRGAENLLQLRKAPLTFWEPKNAKSIVEIFLQYLTKEDIEAKLNGPYSPARFLFSNDNGENIIDSNLEFVENANRDHPIFWVQEKIDEIFNKLRKGQQTFNLGDKLIQLTEPPYGLFNNYANMAIVAFAFRKYINELYDSNGKPRDARLLSDDLVEVFKAWVNGNSSNKLFFRFGSKDELTLSKKLVSLFKLHELKDYNDFSSLTDVRWGIGKYCQLKGYPLWTLKYYKPNQNGIADFLNDIVILCEDPTMNPALVKTVLKGIDEYQYDLMPMINNAKSFLEGFNNFLIQIEAVFVQENEIDEVTKYVKSVLQGDCNLWTEDDVESQVKNWRLNKNRENTSSVNTSTSPTKPENEVKEGSSPMNIVSPVIKQQLYISIESMSIEKTKEILKKIIDECKNEEVLTIIKSYVN